MSRKSFLSAVIALSAMIGSSMFVLADSPLLTVVGKPDGATHSGSYTMTESDIIVGGGGSVGSFTIRVVAAATIASPDLWQVSVKKNGNSIYSEVIDTPGEYLDGFTASAGDVISVTIRLVGDSTPPYTTGDCTATIEY